MPSSIRILNFPKNGFILVSQIPLVFGDSLFFSGKWLFLLPNRWSFGEWELDRFAKWTMHTLFLRQYLPKSSNQQKFPLDAKINSSTRFYSIKVPTAEFTIVDTVKQKRTIFICSKRHQCGRLTNGNFRKNGVKSHSVFPSNKIKPRRNPRKFSLSVQNRVSNNFHSSNAVQVKDVKANFKLNINQLLPFKFCNCPQISNNNQWEWKSLISTKNKYPKSLLFLHTRQFTSTFH